MLDGLQFSVIALILKILFCNSPEAFKRDIFPAKVFGSVEKLPSDEPGTETTFKGKGINNGCGRKKSLTDDNTNVRPRTYSLGEKGLTTKVYDGSDDNETTHNNSKGRPGYNHASSTGTGGAVVGTCNENFFKPIAKKNMANDSPPVPNIGSQVTKAKQRRFRVESSDR